MKTNDFEIVVDDKLDEKVVEHLRNSLTAFNRVHAGHDEHKDLLIAVRDENENIIGGLLGGTYYGYLHVDVLWVDEGYRRRGYGLRMLRAAEHEAIQRGCRYAHLDTHGFQALPFYEKHGYHVVGELKDLPPGDSKYLMRKELTD